MRKSTSTVNFLTNEMLLTVASSQTRARKAIDNVRVNLNKIHAHGCFLRLVPAFSHIACDEEHRQ